MRKHWKALAMVLILAVALAAGCAPKSQTFVLKCGGIQSAEDAATLAMQKMADLVKEKSGGTVEIQVFPASQLGNATSQLEAVSIGSQDMFVDASSFIAQFVPDKNAESMFFAFRDEDHFKKYLASDLMKDMEEQFRQKKGVRVIANNWLRVPRSVAIKNPIADAAGFTGVKMRAPDIKGYLESINAIGAKPTQIAWGETYLALMQGVVDACESPMDSMYTMKFYEATKNIVLTEHIRDNLAVTINDKLYEKLSDSQKQAIAAAAKEAGDWYSQTVKDKAAEYQKTMESEGCNFIQIDTAPLREAVKTRSEQLEKDGMWTAGLYQKIQDIQ